MKSHIRPKVTNKQRERIKELVADEIAKERDTTVRRLLKLVCITLHLRFGFGAGRLSRLIDEINRLLTEEGREPEFWWRVDKEMENLGIAFDKEGKK